MDACKRMRVDGGSGGEAALEGDDGAELFMGDDDDDYFFSFIWSWRAFITGSWSDLRVMFL